MGRFRKVDTKIWNDAKFMSLTDRGKLTFLFLLTHPYQTALGAMRASVPGLAAEMGWNHKIFKDAFDEITERDMCRHDEKASFLWLPNFLRYNKPESPNVVKAWRDSFDFLPECPMKDDLFEGMKAYAQGLSKAFLEAFSEAFHEALPEGIPEALPEAFGKAIPNQEQEQEQEQEKDIPVLFLEFVWMTQKQHQRLVDRFGEEGANKRIEKLNLYIGQKGEKAFYKKYKSCYHCILDWYKDLKENGNGAPYSSCDESGKKVEYV